MSQLSKTIGKRKLKKREKKLDRDKSVQNFDTASSAVILFDTAVPDCFPAIKEFKKFLKKEEIRTSVFGFVEHKEIPQEMLLWADIEFITQKDVNWYGSPRGEIAEKYFSIVPDMLFVFCFSEHLTFEYLTRLSRAKFKIGCFTESDNDLDFMINPSGRECEVDFFIEQLKHYIKLLNPSK